MTYACQPMVCTTKQDSQGDINNISYLQHYGKVTSCVHVYIYVEFPSQEICVHTFNYFNDKVSGQQNSLPLAEQQKVIH